MYATLLSDPIEQTLTCCCTGAPTGASLNYRLMRHSTVVAESGPTTQPSYVWDATMFTPRGGDFHVDVEIDGETAVRTEWQYIPSDSDRAGYEEWLSESADPPDIPLPPLSPARRPFETIAVIQVLPDAADRGIPVSSIAEVADAVHASVFSLNLADTSAAELAPVKSGKLQPGTTHLLTSVEPTSHMTRGGWSVGSGMAFDNGILRRGSHVAQALSTRPETASDLSANFSSLCPGDFLAACLRTDGSVEFHSDYLGASGWYEYRGSRIHIVASNFLLATHLAARCGEKLSLNVATIDADFTSLTQPFQQPLLDDLELQGFACLQPDTVLILRPDGLTIRERSQLGQDTAAPERFTVHRYNELLDRAAEEIVANCTAIASDPEIKRIRCDISGGLDSRLVVAGFLSTLTTSQAELSLYTEPPGRAPSAGDPEIAALVASATGLPFSDQPETQMGPCSVQHLATTQIAATFGIYWHRGHSHAQVWDPTTIYVGGTGIDDVARDYTTGAWQLVTTPALSPREISVNLALQVFKWRGKATLKAAPHDGVTRIAEAWDDLPGDELDKASRLFNSHRARFHGGGSIPAALGTLRANPGPVRSLYLLRLMSGRLFDGPTVQIELIHRLSPELAAVRYESARNNRTYASLYGAPPIELSGDVKQLQLAAERRRAGHRWVSCSSCEASPGGTTSDLKDLTLRALRELGRDPLLHEIMLPAYRFARDQLGTTYNLDHSYSRTFVNKVLHLHSMWRLTQAAHASGKMIAPH